MSDIDWTIADREEWSVGASNVRVFSADGTMCVAETRGATPTITAAEIVTSHNFRLAQSRHIGWQISACIATDYSTWWRIEDDDGKTLGESQPNLLAAMAEFVRLDREEREAGR
jgi:hypothetical protein